MPYFDDLLGLGTVADGGSAAGRGGIAFALIYRQPAKESEEIRNSTRFRFAYAGVTFVQSVQRLVPKAERVIRSFLSEAEFRNGWEKLNQEVDKRDKRS